MKAKSKTALTTTQAIPLSQVVVEPTIYPRTDKFWYTSYKYFQMLKAGAKFPPIVLTKLDGKLILVDGYHRLEAHRLMKVDAIEAETIKCKNLDEAYIEALKRNLTHGLPLSTYEILLAAERLKKMGMSEQQICGIVKMPINEYRKLKAKRGKKLSVVKKTFEHLPEDSEITKEQQTPFTGQKQLGMVTELVNIIENGWLDVDNPALMRGLKYLSNLLSKL